MQAPVSKSQLFSAYNAARHLAAGGFIDRKRLDRALGVCQMRTEPEYHTTLDGCDCKDSQYRPHLTCKHRLALILKSAG
jgi:hypothetical protein